MNVCMYVKGDIRLAPFYDITEVQRAVEAFVAEINADPSIIETPDIHGPHSKYQLPDGGAKGSIELKWVVEVRRNRCMHVCIYVAYLHNVLFSRLAGGERGGLQAGLSRIRSAHRGHEERARRCQALRHRRLAAAHQESARAGLRRADLGIRRVRKVRLMSGDKFEGDEGGDGTVCMVRRYHADNESADLDSFHNATKIISKVVCIYVC